MHTHGSYHALNTNCETYDQKLDEKQNSFGFKRYQYNDTCFVNVIYLLYKPLSVGSPLVWTKNCFTVDCEMYEIFYISCLTPFAQKPLILFEMCAILPAFTLRCTFINFHLKKIVNNPVKKDTYQDFNSTINVHIVFQKNASHSSNISS